MTTVMYKIVNDDAVQVRFLCEECKAEQIVYPYEMADIGTPICNTCDGDMSYDGVLVETSVLG